MENPGIVHWQTLKWTLRSLSRSLKGGLKYTKEAQEEDALEGYVDVDYAGNVTQENIYRVLCLLFMARLLVGNQISNP